MVHATDVDVSDRLGRPLSPSERTQVQAWLSDVESQIEARFARSGLVLADQVSLGAPSPATLVRVESEVVIRRLNQPKPGGPTSVTRSVDDGSLTQRWEGSTPSWSLTEVDWSDLLPVGGSAAFTIRTGVPR